MIDRRRLVGALAFSCLLKTANARGLTSTVPSPDRVPTALG